MNQRVDDLIHLDIGLIDLLVIKTTQHSHTFGISWHKEQIRLIFLTCSEFGLQKQLVDFNLSSLYSQAQKNSYELHPETTQKKQILSSS